MNDTKTLRKWNLLATSMILLGTASVPSVSKPVFLDLTHPIPLFHPSEKDSKQPDLEKPVGNSKNVPTFFPHNVWYKPDIWPTSEGHFISGSLLIQEHNGTSINTPNHYKNYLESTVPGSVPFEKRLSTEQVSISQLTGKVVLLDISRRVTDELAKNGGWPSADPAVTNFSDSSRATVTIEDIEKIKGKLVDGAWLVVHTGWHRFYAAGDASWEKSPYVNNLNHPGLSRAATMRLAELIDQKRINISGVAVDNFSVDSGEAAKGTGENWQESWPSHVYLFQRNIVSVENLTNTDALARLYKESDGQCWFVAGALKHVGGTGGPVRATAFCQV